MTTYWVIAASYAGTERTPLSQLFATPFQATTFLEHIHHNPAYTYAVRPATWRERELRLFMADPETGKAVYRPVVWADEAWWCNIAHHFKDHFLHVSVIDPTAVAFTEDERKGEADRQTYMRPGKYLQKFLAAGPSGEIEHGPLKGLPSQVTKMQIAFYAQWHQVGKRPESDDTLFITEDEHEIVRVYEEGPESCMMGKGWDFKDHPVRVYAGGGLAMAYLNNASGEVIARTLCWPEEQVFGRVYPTANNDTQRDHYNELMARLKAKGWRSITEDNSVFEGARLRHLTNRHGNTMMPYLDNEYGVRDEYRDGRAWWVMTHDENHQESTDGTMCGNEPDWHCECCEEGFSDNYDSCSVYRYWNGTGRSGYPRGEETWCQDCRDNSSYYCDGCDEHFNDNGNAIYAEDGCTYEPRWFEANGGWQCAHSQSYYFKADDPPVVLADGQLIHADHVEDHTFVCWATGLRWFDDSESLAVPGYHVSLDGWAQHPMEWENVVPAMPEDPVDVAAWALAHVIAPLASNHPPPVDPIVEEVYGALTDTGSIEGFVTPRAWGDITINIASV